MNCRFRAKYMNESDLKNTHTEPQIQNIYLQKPYNKVHLSVIILVNSLISDIIKHNFVYPCAKSLLQMFPSVLLCKGDLLKKVFLV